MLSFTVQLLQNIFSICGLNVQRYEQVHGGDINKAYCLFTSQQKYFLKINDSVKYPGMFQKEAKGLDLLRTHCTLIVPKVFKAGESGKHQYLLLEWLEKSAPLKNIWENFGSGLAMMHKQPQSYFGLDEDNYIGSLKQNNASRDEWHSFYSECRIMPLVKRLFDAGNFSSKDIDNANSFCKNLNDIFPNENPSLLHGDLWGGNFLITSPGKAALVDPAVYFGHREMDIGMTKLFGGFDQGFYDAYNEIHPLEKNWYQRIPITQLYPLLVHAVLFGGHYIAATKSIFSLDRNLGSHF
jgi:fructosamine-3-kinase